MPSLAPRLAVSLLVLVVGARAQDVTARDAYNLAAGLHDRGFHEKAIKAFDEYLARFPGDPRTQKAKFYRAQSLLEVGQEADAAAAFAGAVSGPDDGLGTEARLRAGEVLVRLGKPKEAIPLLRAAATARAAAAEVAAAASFLLGEALVLDGDEGAASAAYRVVIDQHAKNRYAPFAASALGFIAVRAGRPAEAATAFAKALELGAEGDLALEAGVGLADALRATGKPDDAAAVYGRVLAKGAGRFEVPSRVGLVEAALAAGKLDRALGELRSLSERFGADPATGKLVLRVAAHCHDRGAAEEGLKVLALLRSEDPKLNADAAYFRGLLLGKSGASERSLPELVRAVEANPTPRRRFALARALSDAGRHDEAIGHFIKVREAKDDASLVAEATFAQAFSENRRGQKEAAVALLETLVGSEAPPDLRRDAAFALAENLFALERYDAAAAAYTAVLAMPTRSAAEALSKRAYCHWQAKRYDQALDDLKALLSKTEAAPFVAEAHFLAGKCHEALGRGSEALASFDAAAKASRDGTLRARAELGAAALARKNGDAKGAAALARRASAAEDRGVKAAALLALGDAELEGGRAEEALAAFRGIDALEAEPTLAARAELGKVYALRGLARHAEAYATALALAQRRPEATILGEALHEAGCAALALDRRTDEVAVLSALLDTLPEHRRADEARLSSAKGLVALGRGAEAEPLLSVLAGRPASHPLRAAALYEWGFCLEALGRNEDRDRAFSLLVKEHAGSELVPDARFRLGESAYAKGQFDEAATHYEAVLADPRGKDLADEAAYKLGWCARKSSRTEQAAERFAIVAEDKTSPLAAEAAYLAGEDLEVLGRHDAARKSFDRSAALAPAHDLAKDARLRSVLLRALQKDDDGVIAQASAALEAGAGLPRALAVRSALADSLAAKRLFARARTVYGEVVAASEGPLGARARYRIGETFADEKNVDAALDVFLELTILSAHEEWAAKAGLAAAEILLAQGALPKAKKLLGDLASRWPERDEGRRAKERLQALDKTSN